MKNNAVLRSSLKKTLPSRIFCDQFYGKNRELNVLRDFPQRLCSRISDMKESERPDLTITLEDMKSYLRIGFEITFSTAAKTVSMGH